MLYYCRAQSVQKKRLQKTAKRGRTNIGSAAFALLISQEKELPLSRQQKLGAPRSICERLNFRDFGRFPDFLVYILI